MSAESKIYAASLASIITGLLVALHVINASQANTLSGLLETGGGLLMSLIAVAYALEALLVKHKAEVADQYYAPPEPTEPMQPQTKQEVVATTPTVTATETPVTPAQ